MSAPALKSREQADPIDPELFDDVSRWWAAESRFDAIVRRTDCPENPLTDSDRHMVMKRLERVSAIFGYQVAGELRTVLETEKNAGTVGGASKLGSSNLADSPTASGATSNNTSYNDTASRNAAVDDALTEGLAGVRALPTTPFAPTEPRLSFWGALLVKAKIRR